VIATSLCAIDPSTVKTSFPLPPTIESFFSPAAPRGVTVSSTESETCPFASEIVTVCGLPSASLTYHAEASAGGPRALHAPVEAPAGGEVDEAVATFASTGATLVDSVEAVTGALQLAEAPDGVVPAIDAFVSAAETLEPPALPIDDTAATSTGAAIVAGVTELAPTDVASPALVTASTGVTGIVVGAEIVGSVAALPIVTVSTTGAESVVADASSVGGEATGGGGALDEISSLTENQE
jgi:hypothetical protein